MKKFTVLTGVILAALAGAAELSGDDQEGGLDRFLGEPSLEIQQVFEGERFPNVAVATDGSVVATWGQNKVRSRRSTDGGLTWEPEVMVGPGIHGGGLMVDQRTGDLLLFVDEKHPPAPTHLYRSRDHGRSWEQQADTVIHPLHRKPTGMVPSMHMDERGITLRHGPHPGRLLRTASNYMGGNIRGGPADAFCNAIYSDDGGLTWDTSAPFPAFGTNEAAVAELSDGRILFIARRHLGTDGLDTFKKHFAWSHDGGETWRDLSVSKLPDGPTDNRYGLMHGLVRLPVQGRDLLVFSNVESDSGRRQGTVWVSFDGGQTWPVKRRIEPGAFAYSSLAAGRSGTPSEGWIYLQYESGPRSMIARFNLAWLLQGEPTGDGTIPDWVR
jgi:sialidase-1